LADSLQEFYLDLYEVDQITEEGYLLLAESVSELENLKKLHIDLSAYALFHLGIIIYLKIVLKYYLRVILKS
jgi:hypothetical protein